MIGNRWIRATLYGLLMALACFALTYDLGDRLMWGDEAETALLAANINKYGLPRVEDGKNRITIYGAADANEQGVWIWSPWLDEYVVAGSFLLFGKSTIAARLPFALIGLASVALLGLVARRIYGSHKVAMGAMLLYVTCVPFLLHARQCRYYAILMLAQIWLIWSYQRILEGGRIRGGVQASLALAVQFYCNYMVIPGNLLGLGLASLLLCRRHPGLIRTMAATVGGAALLAAPWLAYASTSRQLKGLDWLDAAGKAAFHIANINAHIFPLVLLLVPLVMMIRRREEPAPHAMTALLWLLPASQVLCLSFLPFKYFRYATPMIPVIVLLGAAILMTRLKPLWLGTLLLMITAFTNLFSVAGAALFGDLRSPGLPFVTEQTVFVPDPEFPLIFYTDMRVLDARFRKLHEEPDWIIPASPSGLVQRTLPVPPYIDALYEKVTLQVPASPRNGSRPDPNHFAFFTTRQSEQLVLYKKRPRRVELQP